MPKRSEVQRVIDGLETEKAAIQKTIELLKAQQTTRPTRVRKPKVVVMPVAEGNR